MGNAGGLGLYEDNIVSLILSKLSLRFSVGHLSGICNDHLKNRNSFHFEKGGIKL